MTKEFRELIKELRGSHEYLDKTIPGMGASDVALSWILGAERLVREGILSHEEFVHLRKLSSQFAALIYSARTGKIDDERAEEWFNEIR